MGWFMEPDTDMEHEAAVGFVLDTFDTPPVVDVYIDGNALVDVEGFRVVGWAAVCMCGWTGPPAARMRSETIDAREGYSSNGEPPPFVTGWCQGTHKMHVGAAGAR